MSDFKTPNLDALPVRDSFPGTIHKAVQADIRAIVAATLDLADAEQRGYRKGVEDQKSLGFLNVANSALVEAKRYGARIRSARGQWEVAKFENKALAEMDNYAMFAKGAFGSARGIARAEIRQRLERLKNGPRE